MLSSLTSSVLIYHLIAWEREQLSTDPSRRDPIYDQYIKMAEKLEPKLISRLDGSPYIATADLVEGFAFGQQAFLRINGVIPEVLQRSGEAVTVENANLMAMGSIGAAIPLAKISLLAIAVVTKELASSALEFNPNYFYCRRSGSTLTLELDQETLARGVLSQLSSQVTLDWIESLRTILDPVSIKGETTGCPALYTDFFKLVHNWIAKISGKYLIPPLVKKLVEGK